MNIYHGCILAETELFNYTKTLTLCKIGNSCNLCELPFFPESCTVSKLVLNCVDLESGLVVEKTFLCTKCPRSRHAQDCCRAKLASNLIPKLIPGHRECVSRFATDNTGSKIK